MREPLAAYSCGVSSGIAAQRGAPDSLLRPIRWSATVTAIS